MIITIYMFHFNDAITSLRLVEIPLEGCHFTLNNKQKHPLLERLDWFFTSNAWTTSYPNTVVVPLVTGTSDHVPCLVSVSTKIPRAHLFRFDNFWFEHLEFLPMIEQC